MPRSRVSGFVVAIACFLCGLQTTVHGSTAVVELYRRNSTLDAVAARSSRNVAVSGTGFLIRAVSPNCSLSLWPPAYFLGVLRAQDHPSVLPS